MIFAVVAFYWLLGCQGCKKKDITPGDLIKLSDIISAPVIRNPLPMPLVGGRLVFIDEDHFSQAQEFLASMEDSARVHFEDSIGFRSITARMYLIETEEQFLQAQYYDTVPEYLSLAELDAIGYGNYVPGPAYQAAEQAGLVETVYEADSSYYFATTIKAIDMLNVLNELGEVVIGDIRYVYRDSVREAFTFPGGESLGVEPIGKNSRVSTDFNQHWHLGGAPSLSYWHDNWLFDPCTFFNRRFSAKIIYSCSYGDKFLLPIFKFAVKSQVRVFGKWCEFPERYHPLLEVSGSWKYTVFSRVNGTNQSFECPPHTLNGIYQPSPFSRLNLNRSSYERYLDPYGVYRLPSFINSTFYDNAKLFDLLFKFKFTKCTGVVEEYTVQ